MAAALAPLNVSHGTEVRLPTKDGAIIVNTNSQHGGRTEHGVVMEHHLYNPEPLALNINPALNGVGADLTTACGVAGINDVSQLWLLQSDYGVVRLYGKLVVGANGVAAAGQIGPLIGIAAGATPLPVGRRPSANATTLGAWSARCQIRSVGGAGATLNHHPHAGMNVVDAGVGSSLHGPDVTIEYNEAAAPNDFNLHLWVGNATPGDDLAAGTVIDVDAIYRVGA